MKRIGTIIVTILAIGVSLQAEERTKEKEFNSHWFLQLQGGAGHTVGEASFGELISPSAGLYAGYRFTPVWGLRAGVEGWQGKGALVAPTQVFGYNYLQGSVDVMADICNIFSGRKYMRTVSPYLYAGIGANGAFNNDEANSLAASFPAESRLWDGSHISVAGRFGIGTGIKLTDCVHLNIEAGANALDDHFNSKKGSAADWQLTARAGLTFNFGLGKKAKKAAAQQSKPASFEPAAQAKPEEKKPVEETPAVVEEPEKTEPTVIVPATPAEYKDNIYFKIGKFEIQDNQFEKIDNLVKFMNENPDVKVKITGYADSATGSGQRNMFLSEKRAEAVAGILKEKGIDGSRIVTGYEGDTVQPYDTPEQNRVAICITY